MAEDKDILDLARKRFSYCVDAVSQNRPMQIDDMRFYAASPDNGWQWDDKLLKARQNDPNGARPCLTINKLPQHVKQVTNEQRQNRPSIKVLPVDSKSDPEVADVLNGIIRHIEYQSDADTAYDTACECQVVLGEGYWRVLTEYCDDQSFDQDIRIARIRNPLCVYLDPDRKDPTGADMRYGFIVDDLPEEEFKATYPKAKPVDWSEAEGNRDLSHWYLTGEKKVRIAEYFYVETKDRTLNAYASGAMLFEDEIPEATKKALGEPVNSRRVMARSVRWCKLTGQEVLDKREWPGKYIPIIEVIGNEFDIEGVVVRSGIIRNSKDSQRMYNYWSSQETEMLALAPKAPFVATAKQIEGYEDRWQSANVTNYAYLPYNKDADDGVLAPPPQRVMPPMPSAGILQAKLSAADDIKGTTAQYDPSLGNNPQAKSGVALQREQIKSDVANFHYIDNLSRSIKQTGRVIIDLIPKVYDAQRIARIVGEDGNVDQVVVNPKQQQAIAEIVTTGQDGKQIKGKAYNFGVGRYDVRVQVGPSYATQRQETAQMLVDLSQGAADPTVAIAMRYLAVKNMDWSGAQELADILKKLLLKAAPGIIDDESGEEEVPPHVREMMEQLKQSQAALEQKQAELAQAEQEIGEQATATKEEIARLEALKTEIVAADKIAKADAARLSAQLRTQAVEMDAASQKIVGEMVRRFDAMESRINAIPEGGTVSFTEDDFNELKHLLGQLQASREAPPLEMIDG